MDDLVERARGLATHLSDPTPVDAGVKLLRDLADRIEQDAKRIAELEAALSRKGDINV